MNRPLARGLVVLEVVLLLTLLVLPRGAVAAERGAARGRTQPHLYRLMTGGVALVLLGASVAHVLAWVALVVLLVLKTRWEERMLLVVHPGYRAYGLRVGRFLPGVGRLRAD